MTTAVQKPAGNVKARCSRGEAHDVAHVEREGRRCQAAARRHRLGLIPMQNLEMRVRSQVRRDRHALAAGEHGHRQQGPGDGEGTSPDEGPTGPEVVSHPTEQRRADRGAAHEDRHVERHHPAPHLRIGRHLHERVGCGHDGERGHATQRQQQGERQVRRHETGDHLDRSERDGGHDDQPLP